MYYADGRSNKPSIGKHSLATKNFESALANLHKLDRHIAAEAGRAAPVSIAPSTGPIIGEGWKKYLAHRARPLVLGGTSPGTQKRYRAIQDKHVAFCVERRIVSWSEINRKSVEDYGRWLSQREYAANTTYLECTVVKQVVKWMIEEEKILPESQRIFLKLSRSQQSDTYCYSRGEVAAILEHCRQAHMAWLEFLIIALATTGMRIGEALQLRWSDVDLKAGVISLQDNRHSGRRDTSGPARTTKGRQGRRIPIHGLLRAALEKATKSPGGRVFVGPKGGLLKQDDVRMALVNKVLKPLKITFPTPEGDIGFEHGRLHSFRHFFVSQAFYGGASEGEIREWVGHTSSRIVERYRHLKAEDAKRKMDRIEFLDAAPAKPIKVSTEGPVIGD